MAQAVTDQGQPPLDQEDPNGRSSETDEERSDHCPAHEVVVEKFECSDHRGNSPNVLGT